MFVIVSIVAQSHSLQACHGCLLQASSETKIVISDSGYNTHVLHSHIHPDTNTRFTAFVRDSEIKWYVIVRIIH